MYGRTDTKSPMASSSMVHVAGGEGGSIRHDDDGRPARSGGDMNRLRDLTAELRFMPATTDAAAIDGSPYGGRLGNPALRVDQNRQANPGQHRQLLHPN
jgi:hypothetical protein